ncbi:MAG TPA: DinB family protein [Anaerolineales bacterium]
MINAQLMADHFALSLRAIRSQTEGLTHAESLLQLPFRGNCMNWTLGHVLLCREELFDLLSAPRIFADDAFARYDQGSAPITQDEPGVIHLEELLELLDEQAPRLSELIVNTSEETYATEVQVGENKRTIARRVLFYFFHESTHVGELSILRQLAGKDDQVI